MKYIPVICVFLLAGCATAPKLDPQALAEKYYSQTRNYEVLSISGVQRVELAGSNVALTVRAEMQPLSLWPKDPNVAETAIREGVRAALGIAGIVTAGEVMKDLADTKVVNPEVVRPQVVTPVVIP